jgi:tripartite-type tricarboxylate transporter receptor subunit TctC
MIHRPAITRRGLLGAAALGAAGLATRAEAQTRFPSRELSWLIYQAPGGSLDLTARLIQPHLAENGVQTKLDYAIGAGGRIARTRLSRAEADGYTIMTESSPGAVMDEVLGDAAYKALDFMPIFGWSIIGWQFCVKKDSPMRTFADFVNEAKKRRVVVGTIGRSGSSHLQVEIVKKRLGLDFEVVHFEGSGRAYPAVIGGHVDVACSGPASGSRNRENLHFLAVTRPEPALPDVTSLEQQGFPQVESADQMWYAMTSPGVSATRVARLEEAFTKAFQDPGLLDRMKRAGESITPLTSARVREIVEGHKRLVEENKDLMRR